MNQEQKIDELLRQFQKNTQGDVVEGGRGRLTARRAIQQILIEARIDELNGFGILEHGLEAALYENDYIEKRIAELNRLKEAND